MMVECEALKARMRAAREAIKEAKDDLRKFGPESPALVGSISDIATLVAEIDQFKREVVAGRPDIV
jgi:hypothetical protein